MNEAALEERLAARLAEIEKAAAEGRLSELLRDLPGVDDQLRPYIA